MIWARPSSISGSPVAKYMAERGLHITGAGSSPTLISLCRQRLADHEWLVDDMRSLRLPVDLMGFSLGIASFTSRLATNVGCSTFSPNTLHCPPC
jgi:hypothetical protein